ncbi:Elongator complex protein [Thalictrum thalictroides]|uniref:Elongator complex protein 1 n=1 Tax=Thalictrum thalictroides TaxID=46969 RepID=A0A7J6X0B1_THATH|nr:Elongator complex protein [Thalictrum thalictroides]
MKNLKVYSELTSQIGLQIKDEVILFSAFDIERNRLFFSSSANIIYTIQLPLSHEKERAYGGTPLHVEVEPMDLEPGDCTTAMDYVMEKEALLVGTLSGYLLLYIKEDNMTEVVGRVDGGVKSISPSPDGAVLAVITGFGQLLVMTHDWEVLYETVLEETSKDVDAAVTCEPTGHLFESPISWRGDGKYFATLTEVDKSSSQKRIKIWERESGQLHASSESKAFTGAALDWMPSGAKVAASCGSRADKKNPSINFFERNGLERSSFIVDGPMDGIVETLKWNCNSDLLAAVVRYEGYDTIKIWTFSNNHWYLKQEMRYLKKDGVKFMWDPTKSLHLICWTIGGKITTYNFVWVTAVMENSTAFVIDNSNILVSPLALCLMPPPMCLFSLKFSSAVQDIALLTKNSKNLLAACLSDGSLCIAELPADDTWEEMEGKEISIEAVCSEIKFWSFRHLIWLDPHILLGVSYLELGNPNYSSSTSLNENGLSPQPGMNNSQGFFLQEIEIVCSEGRVAGLVTSSGWSAKISNQQSFEGPVIAVAPNPGKGCSAFVQTDGGRILEYTPKLRLMRGLAEQCIQKHGYDVGFSSSCPWMNAVSINDNGVSKPLLLGLDSNSRLHVNGRILCSNCSSLSFYSNSTDHTTTHLILTTKQDLLFIVDIEDIFHDDLDTKYGNFVRGTNKNKENKDSINIWERGAKLVGVIHGDEAAAILQTNRGNVECIYPRKLVLQSIVNALVQGRFKDALHMVRRHRIDFNVIVDHCGWNVFLQSAKEFVGQVNNLSYITEFVCSIKNENVMETLYNNVVTIPCMKDSTGIQDFEDSDVKSKVSSVLLAIRKALEEEVEESPARELCILTTLARSEPPALEEALKRIKVIRDMELLAVHDPHRKVFPSAEEALKHLLWLSDSDAVYDTALGLYDLNLAAIVALNSQKDPKEFLPYLQGLEHMPPVIMQYTIDLRLQRYESALKHLVLGGDAYYEDCMNLMKGNPQLFPLGLQLFTVPAKRVELLEAWGDHLYSEKCFEDAAATYLCCSSLQKALKSYRDCGNWKGVLTMAGHLRMEKKEVLQLANELCEELQALGKPGEAAKVALEYIGDVANGVRCFICAREWEEALRVGLMHEKDDLISEVRNAALECASTLIGEYQDGLEKMGKYLTRYLAVRQRRLVLAAKLRAEDRSSDVDDDLASEASSCFSGMSAYTTGTRKGSNASISSSATSKGREMRRQKKHKGGKIRAGSPGEEMALVEHLKGMSLTSAARRELKSLLITLLMLNSEDIARKLQHAGNRYQLSQMAAVKLAEDTISTENIDEKSHTLEHYIHINRAELLSSEAFSWQSKVLLPP